MARSAAAANTTPPADPPPPPPPGDGDGRIVPYDEQQSRFAKAIARMKPEMARALPKHVTADRMMRVILTTVRRTPELLMCSPESMLGAILQCSQLGLEPDGVLGQAYLIPFNNRSSGDKEVDRKSVV